VRELHQNSLHTKKTPPFYLFYFCYEQQKGFNYKSISMANISRAVTRTQSRLPSAERDISQNDISKHVKPFSIAFPQNILCFAVNIKPIPLMLAAT
jgi:hypothetical protein